MKLYKVTRKTRLGYLTPVYTEAGGPLGAEHYALSMTATRPVEVHARRAFRIERRIGEYFNQIMEGGEA